MEMLVAKGYQARLLAGQDGMVRVIVGPYSDQKSLDDAKSALEASGFRPIRVW